MRVEDPLGNSSRLFIHSWYLFIICHEGVHFCSLEIYPFLLTSNELQSVPVARCAAGVRGACSCSSGDSCLLRRQKLHGLSAGVTLLGAAAPGCPGQSLPPPPLSGDGGGCWGKCLPAPRLRAQRLLSAALAQHH